MDLTELNISRFLRLRLNSDPDTDIANMNADLVLKLTQLVWIFWQTATACHNIRHNRNLGALRNQRNSVNGMC